MTYSSRLVCFGGGVEKSTTKLRRRYRSNRHADAVIDVSAPGGACLTALYGEGEATPPGNEMIRSTPAGSLLSLTGLPKFENAANCRILVLLPFLSNAFAQPAIGVARLRLGSGLDNAEGAAFCRIGGDSRLRA
jgi:hypothetical protein